MNKKFLIGGLIGVVVIVAGYFGAGGGGGVQGKLQGSQSVTRAELAVLLGDTINPVKILEVPFGDSLNCFSDIKGDESYALYACALSLKGIMPGFASGDNATGKWSYFWSPSDYVTREQAMRYFVDAHYFVSKGSVGMTTDFTKQKAVLEKGVPYTDIAAQYQDNFGPKFWYYDFATLGIGDVPAWKGKKFSPQAYLAKGRAQLWADNLKKALQ